MNLNQVTVYSTKTVETVAFYQKLGLLLIVDSLPRYARLECPDGQSTLSISHVASEGSDNEHTKTITIYFECDDLDAEVARLKLIGIPFDQEPVDQPWLWREAYLKDPNGNNICLYYAAENRLYPPWRVK